MCFHVGYCSIQLSFSSGSGSFLSPSSPFLSLPVFCLHPLVLPQQSNPKSHLTLAAVDFPEVGHQRPHAGTNLHPDLSLLPLAWKVLGLWAQSNVSAEGVCRVLLCCIHASELEGLARHKCGNACSNLVKKGDRREVCMLGVHGALRGCSVPGDFCRGLPCLWRVAPLPSSFPQGAS